MTTRTSDLLERRASLIKEMRSIEASPAGDGGDLSLEQHGKFNMLKEELERVEKGIERHRLLDEAERRMHGENITGNGDNSDQHFHRELRNYRLLRGIAGQAGLAVDDGFEKEIGQETAKRSGRSFEGLPVPLEILTHMPIEKRVLTTAAPVGGPGSNLISTDYYGDQFVNILSPASMVYGAGATLIPGLRGNVVIPSRTKSQVLGWVGENSALSFTDPEFLDITLAPKICGCIGEVSRNMALQSSPEIETLYRQDTASVIGTGIDKVALVGGGSNEPVGVLATSGIGDVAGGAAGLAPTWLNVLALIAAVQNANGSAMTFFTTFNAVKKMRGTVRVASTDSRMIMEEKDSLAGYPLRASNNVPNNLVKGGSGAVCSALIFGDASEILIGVWSALDILVNPYESTAYSKGNIQIRAMATVDVKLRHAASFAATKDVLTT